MSTYCLLGMGCFILIDHGFFGFDKVVEQGYLFGKPGDVIPILINKANVAL